MVTRPRLTLSDELMGRCADLVAGSTVPIDDRDELVERALALGLDELVVIHAHDLATVGCSVEGCTDPAIALVDGGYRCRDCFEFDTGGQL